MIDRHTNFKNFMEGKYSGYRLSGVLIALSTIAAMVTFLWGWHVASFIDDQGGIMGTLVLETDAHASCFTTIGEYMSETSGMIFGLYCASAAAFLLLAWVLYWDVRITRKVNALLAYIQTPEGREHLDRLRSGIGD